MSLHGSLYREFTVVRANVTKSYIQHFTHSDHSSVHLQLHIQDIKTGRGTWILNQSLLIDENTFKKIKTLWKDWQTKKYDFTTLGNGWRLERKKLNPPPNATVKS